MGVLSCSRNGCGNIMCDIHIPKIGYVCYECRNEFVEYAKSKSIGLLQSDIIGHLSDFIETEKNSFNSEIEYELEKFFNEYSR